MKSVAPFNLQHASITKRSACFDTNVSFQQWSEAGKMLSSCHDSLKFWLGDWFLFGKERWPERMPVVAEQLEIDLGLVREYATACKIPAAKRSDHLTFGHHKAAADSLDSHDQIEFLALAESNDWSVPDMRREISRRINPVDKEPKGAGAGFVPSVWAHDFLRWAKKQDFDSWEEANLDALRDDTADVLRILKSLQR